VVSLHLQENLCRLWQRIERSCQRVGRQPQEVKLLAASKSRTPQEVEELRKLGQRLFGENRVQEAKAKIPLCSSDLEWHMIGHLQRNKVRHAVQIFDMVHSVDSVALAEELNRQSLLQGKHLRVLVQVNVSGESTKHGLTPESARALLERSNEWKHLEFCGLMTMAPYCEDPERARPWFRMLRQLRDTWQKELGLLLPELSMGMSGDLEPAVEEGATIVRVGTALFGPRVHADTDVGDNC